MNNNILLINPWIYDFKAYDFWIKPLGILYIASVLRELGADLHLINCLDRSAGTWHDTDKKLKYGCSKFYNDINKLSYYFFMKK